MTAWRASVGATALLATLLLLAAAPMPAGAQPEAEAAVYDPLERVNRGIFAFNEWFDHWVLEPGAIVWGAVFPHSFQVSLRSAVDNARTPLVLVSDLLQGKPRCAALDLSRIVINSTLGIGGLFDPATHFGLEGNDEDLGQTFGVWGIPAGPYLVIPLLGASNPRDVVGTIVEAVPQALFLSWVVNLAANTADIVNRRTLLLETIREERELAFDLYAAVRNAYVHQRRNQVADAREDENEEADDFYYFDDEEEAD